MSHKVPPEYEWIRPGTAAKYRSLDCVVELEPFLYDGKWFCYLTRWGDKKLCEHLTLSPTITLKLTRNKAKGIASILGSVLHYGPSEELAELKKQIEDTLNE